MQTGDFVQLVTDCNPFKKGHVFIVCNGKDSNGFVKVYTENYYTQYIIHAENLQKLNPKYKVGEKYKGFTIKNIMYDTVKNEFLYLYQTYFNEGTLYESEISNLIEKSLQSPPRFKIGEYVKFKENVYSKIFMIKDCFAIGLYNYCELNCGVVAEMYLEKVEPKYKINESLYGSRIISCFLDTNSVSFCYKVLPHALAEPLVLSEKDLTEKLKEFADIKVGDMVEFNKNEELYDGKVYKVTRIANPLVYIEGSSGYFFWRLKKVVKDVKDVKENGLPIKKDGENYYYWFFSAQELNGKNETLNICHYVFYNINDKLDYFRKFNYVPISYKIVNRDQTPGILFKFTKD